MARYDSLLDANNELFIDENNWVLAILRKPEGRNPEHAFLMVEGVNQFGQVCLFRYDLFIDNRDSTKAMIKVNEKAVAANRAKEALIEDMLNNDDISGKCWSISKDQAKKLHENIVEFRENPGKYNLLGDTATIPKTGDALRGANAESAEPISTSVVKGVEKTGGKKGGEFAKQALLTSSGHSCFTWSRTMIHSLGDKRLQRELPIKAEDLGISITSRHLKARPQESGTNPPFSCQIS